MRTGLWAAQREAGSQDSGTGGPVQSQLCLSLGMTSGRSSVLSPASASIKPSRCANTSVILECTTLQWPSYNIRSLSKIHIILDSCWVSKFPYNWMARAWFHSHISYDEGAFGYFPFFFFFSSQLALHNPSFALWVGKVAYHSLDRFPSFLFALFIYLSE